MRRLFPIAAAALAITMISLDSPIEARENRVVKCNVRAARAAPGYAGPALVANIPRSMTPIDLNAVQFIDDALTRQVVVEGLFARRSPTDTVEVTARLVNCTNRAIQVQARSSFMDEAQLPTESPSAWSRVHIPARGTGIYQEKSISGAEVKYYLIELSSAR